MSSAESNGGNVIAEYDGNNNLLRKYTYGPGIDQPVSMTEVGDSSSPYYYHYDALGSVVALSDSTGDTVQTYEYSVYGQVAVEDANHPNPYMFAGRRYDIEIGLYYNRARYYNPYMGRFLQTDPIGYEDGINWYAYCKNNPLNFVDPSGLHDSFKLGSVQVVTGRYWVVPETLKLGGTLSVTLGIGGMEKLLAPGIIHLGKNGCTTAEQVDAQLLVYDAYLKALAAAVPSPFPIGTDVTLGWCAYIEVMDWKDTNDDDVMDGGDDFSEPYWIEITGFHSGEGEDVDTGAFFTGRYETMEQAADAAGTAIGYAWGIGIPGVLPGANQVRGRVDDSVEDPYNRESHHHKDVSEE